MGISVYLKRILLITILSFGIVKADDGAGQILNTDSDNDNFLIYATQNYNANPDELLSRTQSLLEDYPRNAMAHLARGKIYYLAKGNLEKAVFELNTAQSLYNEISQNEDSLNAEQKKIYMVIRDDTALLLDEISFYFGDLRFKISGIKISSLARIEGATAIFQYNQATYQQAAPSQKLRLDFLRDNLTNIKFQFTDWDSVTNEMFFKIAYFPIIFSDIPEPYNLTINNECRYHFNLQSNADPPIEIEWLSGYRLVKSVPEMVVGLEHPKTLSISPVNPKNEIITRQPIVLEDYNMINTYLPVVNDKVFDIHLDPDYPGRLTEKIINILSGITTVVMSAGIIIMIR